MRPSGDHAGAPPSRDTSCGGALGRPRHGSLVRLRAAAARRWRPRPSRRRRAPRRTRCARCRAPTTARLRRRARASRASRAGGRFSTGLQRPSPACRRRLAVGAATRRRAAPASATLAAGTAIANTSTSSAESRSETNATRRPSGETRGCVSLSVVSVSGRGACQASDPATGATTKRSHCSPGSADAARAARRRDARRRAGRRASTTASARRRASRSPRSACPPLSGDDVDVEAVAAIGRKRDARCRPATTPARARASRSLRACSAFGLPAVRRHRPDAIEVRHRDALAVGRPRRILHAGRCGDCAQPEAAGAASATSSAHDAGDDRAHELSASTRLRARLATRACTAATMWRAEMPYLSSSSSGLPLRGISRTARRVTAARRRHGARHGVADAAGRIVILDGDQAAGLARRRRSASPRRSAAASRDR